MKPFSVRFQIEMTLAEKKELERSGKLPVVLRVTAICYPLVRDDAQFAEFPELGAEMKAVLHTGVE